MLKLSLFFTAMITLVSLSSQAQFLGVEGGIRQVSATANNSAWTTSTQMAYQFGLVGAFVMTDKVLFRSGFLYTQSPITAKINGTDTKYTFNYFEIPVTFLWKLSDFGGPYAGVNVALMTSADCDNCGTSPSKKSALPFVIGGSFKFAPNFGVDVYYEMIGKVNDDFKDASSVGANLLVTFD